MKAALRFAILMVALVLLARMAHAAETGAMGLPAGTSHWN